MTVPETLLFISTLDGNLHAVSKSTGDIKWTLKDGEDGPGGGCSQHGCPQAASGGWWRTSTGGELRARLQPQARLLAEGAFAAGLFPPAGRGYSGPEMQIGC